ncbi:17315_t:CDS:2, partial [Dentiscutata erythropus]
MPYCIICYFKKPEPEFKVWISGNDTIDMIIRRTQVDYEDFFYWEWIDPKDLVNIQYLADGGLSSVYKATWLKGYPRRHNGLRPQRGSVMVALKTLGSFDEATSIIDEFNNKLLSNKKDLETCSEIYGLTFLVQKNQIAIVMDFYEEYDEKYNNQNGKQTQTKEHFSEPFSSRFIPLFTAFAQQKKYKDTIFKKVQNDNSLLTSIELVCPKCYLDCRMCNRPCQDDEEWCNRCSVRKPKTGLKNLTRGFEKYNKLAQDTYQIDKEKDLEYYLEWINPERIVDIQHLDNGGFSSVYTAKWLDGYPREPNGLRPRKGPVTIALKIFNLDDKDKDKSFDTEIAVYTSRVLAVLPVRLRNESFGITIVPGMGIAMVMEFCEGGNLRSFLQSICDESRPKINEGTPTFWVKLMQRFWDNDPKKRPSAIEVVGEVISELEVIQKMPQEEFYEYLKRDLTKEHPNTAHLSKFISIITNNENSDYEYIIHEDSTFANS